MRRSRAALDAIVTDLCHAARSLYRSKKFTFTAVLTIALGSGANVAVLSVYDRLLFRPLPYAAPDRLVQAYFGVAGPDLSIQAAFMHREMSEVLRREAVSFGGDVAWEAGWLDSTVPSPGQNPLLLAPVTTNVLEVLGVTPLIGRRFTESDALRGDESPVLLDYNTWRTRFGATPDILSRHWSTARQTFRVVGVLPPGFFLPSSFLVEHRDGIVPLKANRSSASLMVAPIARLASGVSRAAAQAEIDAISVRHQWQSPILRQFASSGQQHVTVQPIRAGISMLVAPYLWMTSLAVWAVLLVACANLSTLLVMRERWRRRETAMKIALGAPTRRLIQASIFEALWLSIAGSAVAWATCMWAQGSIAAVVPPTLRGFAVQPFDGRILWMSFGAAVVAALAAAAAPALALRRTDVLMGVRGGGGGPLRRAFGIGNGLLIVEAAFGAVVIAVALAYVPAFIGYLLRPPGFVARDLYAVSVNHRWSEDADAPARDAARTAAVIDVLRRIPNVASLSPATGVPFFDTGVVGEFWKMRGLSGRQWGVGAGMFRTLGASMRAGREFTPADLTAHAPVAVLNESAARALWSDLEPAAAVGQTIALPEGTRTVIGVVRDLRGRPGIDAAPALFLPFEGRAADLAQTALPVIVRMATSAVPDQHLIVTRLNERFPANGIRIESASAMLAPFADRPRFLAVLFGVLLAIIVLLCGVGVYAVAAFEAAQRRREVAIRLALGASPARVRALVHTTLIAPVSAGALAGLVAAWFLLKAMQAHLHTVADVGWPPVIGGALIVIGTAVVAASGPAASMAGIDPIESLRVS